MADRISAGTLFLNRASEVKHDEKFKNAPLVF